MIIRKRTSQRDNGARPVSLQEDYRTCNLRVHVNYRIVIILIKLVSLMLIKWLLQPCRSCPENNMHSLQRSAKLQAEIIKHEKWRCLSRLLRLTNSTNNIAHDFRLTFPLQSISRAIKKFTHHECCGEQSKERPEYPSRLSSDGISTWLKGTHEDESEPFYSVNHTEWKW